MEDSGDDSTILEKGILKNGRNYASVFERIYQKYHREYEIDETGGAIICLGSKSAEEKIEEIFGEESNRSTDLFSLLDSSSDSDSDDADLAALLHEKVVRVKKEINWDEEEMKYKSKQHQKKSRYQTVDSSSDSELECESLSTSEGEMRQKRKRFAARPSRSRNGFKSTASPMNRTKTYFTSDYEVTLADISPPTSSQDTSSLPSPIHTPVQSRSPTQSPIQSPTKVLHVNQESKTPEPLTRDYLRSKLKRKPSRTETRKLTHSLNSNISSVSSVHDSSCTYSSESEDETLTELNTPISQRQGSEVTPQPLPRQSPRQTPIRSLKRTPVVRSLMHSPKHSPPTQMPVQSLNRVSTPSRKGSLQAVNAYLFKRSPSLSLTKIPVQLQKQPLSPVGKLMNVTYDSPSTNVYHDHLSRGNGLLVSKQSPVVKPLTCSVQRRNLTYYRPSTNFNHDHTSQGNALEVSPMGKPFTYSMQQMNVGPSTNFTHDHTSQGNALEVSPMGKPFTYSMQQMNVRPSTNFTHDHTSQGNALLVSKQSPVGKPLTCSMQQMNVTHDRSSVPFTCTAQQMNDRSLNFKPDDTTQGNGLAVTIPVGKPFTSKLRINVTRDRFSMNFKHDHASMGTSSGGAVEVDPLLPCSVHLQTAQNRSPAATTYIPNFISNPHDYTRQCSHSQTCCSEEICHCTSSYSVSPTCSNYVTVQHTTCTCCDSSYQGYYEDPHHSHHLQSPHQQPAQSHSVIQAHTSTGKRRLERESYKCCEVGCPELKRHCYSK